MLLNTSPMTASIIAIFGANMPTIARVNIIKKPGEFVPIYELILPKFEEATIAILDAIKAKLITVIPI